MNRLEKLALIFLYNFHREHSLLKSIIKKLSPKINVKNIKKSSIVIGYENNFDFDMYAVKIGKILQRGV